MTIDQLTAQLREKEQREDRAQHLFSDALSRVHQEWNNNPAYAFEWADEDGILIRQTVIDAIKAVAVAAEVGTAGNTMDAAKAMVTTIMNEHAEMRMHVDDV